MNNIQIIYDEETEEHEVHSEGVELGAFALDDFEGLLAYLNELADNVAPAAKLGDFVLLWAPIALRYPALNVSGANLSDADILVIVKCTEMTLNYIDSKRNLWVNPRDVMDVFEKHFLKDYLGKGAMK